MLPKGWTLVHLGSLLEAAPQNGYSPVCPDEPTGKWVLGLGTLGNNGIDLSQAKPAPLDDPLVDRFLLRPGDFLISRSNTLDRVGRIAVFRGGIDQYAYPDLMMRFRIEATRANPDYVEAYLRGERVSKYIQRHATGTSGSMKKINQGIVEGVPILLPPLTTQREIAELLSTWTAAIEKTEQIIAAKEKRLHWLSSQLLSGSMQLPAFKSRAWRKVAFGDIFSPKKVINSVVQDLEVLSVTKSGIVRQSDYFNKDVASADKSQYLVVSRGDLVMSGLNFWMGSIDFQHICDKGIVSPAYKTFELSVESANPEYMRFFVRCPLMTRVLLRSSVQGASIVRRNLDMDQLNASKLHLPGVDEQVAIAGVLASAQREVQLHKQLLDELELQKRGLMQNLLAGRWHVKVSEGAEVA